MMLRFFNKETLDRLCDDGISTHTSEEQRKVEESIEKSFNFVKNLSEIDPDIPKLFREKHANYLTRGLLRPLPSSFQCLDASRPWITYWIVHSLNLLSEDEILVDNSPKIIDFLKRCANERGGYGGGPGQISHLATTYAAVNALVSLTCESALNSINRDLLKSFLYHMKQEDGSFNMHMGGESDVRGAYCAASVASLTGIMTKDLFEKTGDWIASCQTYEGGFSGVPGGEAHGGYTFCAIAALVLLNSVDKCDLKSLTRWVVNKQQRFEGGFSGRTNKLVDGCYSFWQGAVLPILHLILLNNSPQLLPVDKWLFNQQALQEYLLCCCQDPRGGLVDKPSRPRDFYHTCYDLSGLSVAQHSLKSELIVGPTDDNRLIQVHPIYNLAVDSVKFALEYFSQKPT